MEQMILMLILEYEEDMFLKYSNGYSITNPIMMSPLILQILIKFQNMVFLLNFEEPNSDNTQFFTEWTDETNYNSRSFFPNPVGECTEECAVH